MSSSSLGFSGRLFAYNGLVFHLPAHLSLRDGLDASLAVLVCQQPIQSLEILVKIDALLTTMPQM
jgi:hypothetical protein